MKDRDLLPSLIDGDPVAWERFVRDHAGRLQGAVGLILRRAHHDASSGSVEDVVQAVFLKLWADDRRRLRTFRGTAKLSTWLVAIARREALDRLRRVGLDRRAKARLRHEAQADGPREAGRIPGPASAAAARDLAVRMQAALGELPGRDRLLLQLIELDGLTYAQAASLLNVRENSVGPLLQRARRRLKACLPTEHAP